MEKLHRTIYLAILVGLLLLSSSFLIAFSDRMPLTIQRSLSFLPLKVESVAKSGCRRFLELASGYVACGRVGHPRYFWVGKGFSINPTDLYFSQIALRRGFYSPSEAARLAVTIITGRFPSLFLWDSWGDRICLVFNVRLLGVEKQL